MVYKEKKNRTFWKSIGIFMAFLLLVALYIFFVEDSKRKANIKAARKKDRVNKELEEQFGKLQFTRIYMFNGAESSATIRLNEDPCLSFSIEALPRGKGKKHQLNKRALVVSPKDDALVTVVSREKLLPRLFISKPDKPEKRLVCPHGGTHLLLLSNSKRIKWEEIRYSNSGSFPLAKFETKNNSRRANLFGLYKVDEKSRKVYGFDETPPGKIKTAFSSSIPISGGIKFSVY